MTISLRRAAVAACAAALLVLAGCGDGGDSNEGTPAGDGPGAGLDLVNDGTLTACTNAPYPPFEFEDAEAPSGYSGFDIDLLQAMADDLGLDLRAENVRLDALQSGTSSAAGQCDLGASAITKIGRAACRERG